MSPLTKGPHCTLSTCPRERLSKVTGIKPARARRLTRVTSYKTAPPVTRTACVWSNASFTIPPPGRRLRLIPSIRGTSDGNRRSDYSLRQEPFEERNGSAQAFSERNFRFPVEEVGRFRDVRPTLLRIIRWKGTVHNLRAASGEFDYLAGELGNREFGRVSEIKGTSDMARRIHEPHKPVHEIVDVTEGSALLARPKDGKVTG